MKTNPDETACPAAARDDRKISGGTTVLLGMLTAFAPASIDLTLPSLPRVALALNAPIAIAQLSFTALFLGFAIGQLIYGPLSDRVGRRVPLLTGIGLYVAASIGCMLAQSIEVLLLLRLVQGLGGCAGPVIARAIVRDRADARASAEIYSAMLVVAYLAPVAAPIVGSQILRFADWNSVFGVLGAFGAICFIASALWLRESLPTQAALLARSESPSGSYWAMLREPRFLGYALCGMFSQAALMTYVVSVPDLLMNTFGFSAQTFGWIFALNGVGLVLSSYFNRLLLRRYSYEAILEIANYGALAVAVCLLIAGATRIGGAWTILPLLSLLVFSTGFMIANALAGAMSVDPKRAGSASALAGGGQFGGGALCALLVSLLHDGSAVPMGSVILGAYLVAGIALQTLTRRPVGRSVS